MTNRRAVRDEQAASDGRARVAALEAANAELTAKVAELSFVATVAARLGAMLDQRTIVHEVLGSAGVAVRDRSRPRFVAIRNGNELECAEGSSIDPAEAQAFVHTHRDALGRCLRTGDVVSLDGYAVFPIASEPHVPGYGCIVVQDAPTSKLDAAARHLLGRLSELAGRSFANAQVLAKSLTAGVTDDLTGVYNRRYFDRRLAEELRRARRLGERMGLILLDLDLFKDVNDRFGHPEGDRTLRAAAHTIVASVRDIDAVTRWGGEEFAVIVPGADGRQAMVVAERIRLAIESLALRTASGHDLRVTVSGGVAWAASDIHTPAQCLAAADRALLEAKRCGRNRTVAMCDPGDGPPPGRPAGMRESVVREHRGSARDA